MNSRTHDFVFSPNYNFGTENLLNYTNPDGGGFTPIPITGNFELLNNTPFLLLDGTNFLLL